MTGRTVGICGTQMRDTPRRNIICDLPAEHAGWHSAPDYEAMQPDVLQVVPRIDWSDTNSAEAKLARIEELFNDDTWWVISEHRLRNKVRKILAGDNG